MQVDLTDNTITSLAVLASDKVQDVITRSRELESHSLDNEEQNLATQLDLRNEFFWWNTVLDEIQPYAQKILQERLNLNG